MNKRALLIAYHYPPVKGSSGVQRALRFSAYLPEFGWDCDVLTVTPSAYERVADDELKDIPEHVRVVRARAFDTKRHLSIAGRYPQFLALPDRWSTWKYDGVRQGKKMLKRDRYDLVWSTFPISTAHVIGMRLAASSGLPWVADCRDSMSEEDYPRDPTIFAAVRSLEQQVVANATRVTFTTPGTRAMYAERYPDLPDDRWDVIENGYDESAFIGLDDEYSPPGDSRPLTLVHAGLLYPEERDPRHFFRALAELKAERFFVGRPIRVVLRATGHDELYRDLIDELDIADIVELAPGVAYRDALQEMLKADGLLIFQSSGCNHQIPAKAYEYLRAGRPVFSLTDPAGDTAKLLAENNEHHMADLLDKEKIKKAFVTFFDHCKSHVYKNNEKRDQYSRRLRTKQLAALFDSIV
ncbi:MAG: glycosyltransferase [Pseudomonadota bacterium]